jgi:PIF1-like helicase
MSSKTEFDVQQAVRLLEQSQWISCTHHCTDVPSCITSTSEMIDLPNPTPQLLKKWKLAIKEQECIVAHNRRNAQEKSELHIPSNSIADTELLTEAKFSPMAKPMECAPTDVPKASQSLVSVEDIINDIGARFNMNERQWIAFRIIARSFVQKHVYKQYSDKDPLHMFMTGPGGTGKTHVVKAVREVMRHYGAAHQIRFLAPTGSAAALIDGMTIHKGLGIKVKSNEKGKGNCKLGEQTEDYTVIISVQNRTQLRDEMGEVEVVLLDECSLMSCEIMSEVDSAFRFAKERLESWFGGIMMIFTGDLYQYPPIGTALYTPISAYAGQSNAEISKRLGRLAWKTVNTVVTLTEQRRMIDDPEYGDAVMRLRTRECTVEDMDLFNSQVIKSAAAVNGIDMGSNDNSSATAIVRTNLLRETLNHRKAEANSVMYKKSLVVCAALDKCASKKLSHRDREQLLKLNLTSSKIKDALPGFVPLYVGMPVILRMRNLSTDLGITNGSQGIVRRLDTAICPAGFTYCTCVLVEFPESKVILPDLPKGYFPIVPVTTTFTTVLTLEDGTKITIQLTRSQVPVQPGFAVTGQSAQGKTLPSVLANLHDGGFGAYVAASRAPNRKGLCITEPVTLQQLNKPLPHDLLLESACLDALEHNTYIEHGFADGPLVKVIDPESERSLARTTFKARFDNTEDKQRQNKSKKRKSEDDGHDADGGFRIPKRKHVEISTNDADTTSPPSAGCVWSEVDWSCAYDSTVMSMFYTYMTFSAQARHSWTQLTPLNRALAVSFDHLRTSAQRIITSEEFNIIREHVRDFLSSRDPQHFPRRVGTGAPVDLIFDYLTESNDGALSVMYKCPASHVCGPPSMIPIPRNLPVTFTSGQWNTWCNHSDKEQTAELASIQTWIDKALKARHKLAEHLPMYMACDNPCKLPQPSEIVLRTPPPLLKFEITPGIHPAVDPSITIHIPGPQRLECYTLRAIIYLGGFHFTARMLDSHDNIWSYDGRQNKGFPWRDNHCATSRDPAHVAALATFDGHPAYLYIYSL